MMNLTDVLQKMLDKYVSLLPQPKPQNNAFSNTKIIAHRGVHDNKTLIENTYLAFESAAKLNLWGIEFDIHETCDNEFIVNHDPTLKRLWGVDKAIRELTLKQVQAVSDQIPTLNEVINRFGKKLHLFIELKAPFNNEPLLLATLKDLIPGQDYHLLSLNEKTFANLTQIPKKSFLMVPEISNVKHFCNISINQHYGGVLGHYLLMRNKFIKCLKNKNQQVGVGFVDSKNSLYREVNRGIEWLFTNNAPQIRQYIPQ